LTGFTILLPGNLFKKFSWHDN